MPGDTKELETFAKLWRGGYLEGDPLDPLGASSYADMGYISVLHATYQVCIKPFVTGEARVLEIGPGRGAWTRTMLGAREVWCLDALSAEHNGFWEHIGREHADRVRYHQVEDFSCRVLPDEHFDFLFSFGAFCHVTWEGQKAYYRNLLRKLKPSANAIVMFADFDKYNAAVRNWSFLRARRVGRRSAEEWRRTVRHRLRAIASGGGRPPLQDKSDERALAGRFYHAGIAETSTYLTEIGWRVVNPDVGLLHRDAIVHFVRPALEDSVTRS
jgi:hypothetical protein